MSVVERCLLRLMMAVFVVLLLGGAAWGPSHVLRSLLGAGTPNAGEVVPRQIPYRGYIEQNGTPLSSSGIPMRFRLLGIDGGVLHEETLADVVVQNGQFAVELGDVTPIPSAVLRNSFVELEVGVGSPPQVLQGRQRILSVPFARGSEGGSPPGTIVAFGGEVPPSGWLLCDGAAVSNTQFTELCATLGTSWGMASAGSCKLPDLRGRFLRGAHAPLVDEAGDRPVGSTQGDQNQIHAHVVAGDGSHSHTIIARVGAASGAGGWADLHPIYRNPGAPSMDLTSFIQTSGGDHGHAVSTSGGEEARPKNAAVNYIIKY